MWDATSHGCVTTETCARLGQRRRTTFADDCASGTRVVPDGAGVAIEDVPVTLLTLGKQV